MLLSQFGIITSFKLKTIPLPSQVWGGQIVYSEDKFDQVSEVISSFSTNNVDPKAAILPSFTGLVADAITVGVVQLFYDGPSPPAGTFDAFLNIPSISKDVKARTYLELLEATPAGAVNGLRTYFHPVPVKAYSPRLVKAFAAIASVRVEVSDMSVRDDGLSCPSCRSTLSKVPCKQELS